MSEEQERLQWSGKKTPEGRPIYVNQWVDWVTERTITEDVPELGGFINIPTVHNGKFLNADEAIKLVKESKGRDPITGRKLETFSDVNAAVESAKARSSGLGDVLSEIMLPGPQGAVYK